ncbi:MAG: lysine--tRNA ligase [Candidatus Micrarchaeia archaeon]
MDPLRKVPAGVPEEYVRYIGMPITSVPDPWGCHESYAEHHKSEYLKVIRKFVHSDLEIYSMQEEYDRGNFSQYILRAMEKIEDIKSIMSKYRTTPIPSGWSPWVPVCEKCGKISTTRVIEVKGGRVHYKCSDYKFETQTAKGCGHEGWADPSRDKGKLMWKSEWAAQWARWSVCTEGAGKEYQVPMSAFWTNGEIVERVFDFPMPEPIFYEHLMIDNMKMSASLGNVVYPKDWLQVAEPEHLRYFYNKRLMKTRSFSWKDLPQIYDEYDRAAAVYFGEQHLENKNDEAHLKRLYEVSAIRREKPLKMSFSHAAVLAQLFRERDAIITSLKKTGHYDEGEEDRIMNRIEKARFWVEHYAPEESRFKLQEEVNPEIKLSEKQREALRAVAKLLKERHSDEKEFSERMYAKIKEVGIDSKEFFKAGYLVLLNKERGPRLAPFLLTLGEKAIRLFESV